MPPLSRRRLCPIALREVDPLLSTDSVSIYARKRIDRIMEGEMFVTNLLAYGLTGWLLAGAWCCVALAALWKLSMDLATLMSALGIKDALDEIVFAFAPPMILGCAAILCVLVAALPLLPAAAAAIGPSPLGQ
jgi:hypothetical protein